MNTDVLNREVDANYDFFQRTLALLLPEHQGEYALLKQCKIEGYFGKAGEAYRAGLALFPDRIFSIQEVTAEAEDLGFFSHAGT